jgi:hypothetical protein
MIGKNYSNLVIINKMSNDDYNTPPASISSSCWLCGGKTELKVYTDFGRIMHLCKRCYGIYDHYHRLKTEEICGDY